MRILVLLGIGAAAAVLAPAAVGSTSFAQPGQTATTRACGALRASVGADLFVRQYASLGACVRQWLAGASTARTQAVGTCRTLGLGGGCVARRFAAIMTRRLHATAPFMRHCGAQLNLIGPTGFVARYGGPGVVDAFGQCVFPKTVAGVGGAPRSTQSVYSLPFTVSPLAGSGAGGEGYVQVDADGIVLSVALSGAEPGQHGLLLVAPGSSCAAAAQGVDAGGSVAMTNGAVLAVLGAQQQTGIPVQVVLPLATGVPLAGRQVLVLGKTVDGVYDQAYPIACGTLAG